MCKAAVKYLSAHPYYNAIVHTIAGMGLGTLLVMPVFGGHTIRWGVGLLLVALLGHLYPLMVKEKGKSKK